VFTETGNGLATLGFDETLTDGVSDQFYDGGDAQFAHYCGTMRFHGSDADPESLGSFLVGFPLCQQLYDFSLAFR
jgi:hypothetical protein